MWIASDRFMPRQFMNLGDRLVYNNGIIVLGTLASILILVFRASTHALIPLYAVGVFISFTLSPDRHGATLVAAARSGLAGSGILQRRGRGGYRRRHGRHRCQ